MVSVFGFGNRCNIFTLDVRMCSSLMWQLSSRWIYDCVCRAMCSHSLSHSHKCTLLYNLLLCLSAHLYSLTVWSRLFRVCRFLAVSVTLCRGTYVYTAMLCVTVTHLYHEHIVLERCISPAEGTQCWNSRHADIDFLCSQPIARYNFLSDEVEEQSDTHRLSHDAREDVYLTSPLWP